MSKYDALVLLITSTPHLRRALPCLRRRIRGGHLRRALPCLPRRTR